MEAVQIKEINIIQGNSTNNLLKMELYLIKTKNSQSTTPKPNDSKQTVCEISARIYTWHSPPVVSEYLNTSSTS